VATSFLVVNQGADQTLEVPNIRLAGSPLNPAGFSVRGQVRLRASSPTVLHSWSSTGSTPNATLAPGTALLRLDASVTSAWTWRRGEFDVELIDPEGRVARIAAGVICVSPEITR